MFHHLDATLKSLLGDPHAPDELRAAEVSFLTPDRDFKADQGPRLNLFLQEVHENAALRDPLPVVELNAGSYERRPPPLRVDCTYMVSAWSNETGDKKIVDEHRLLGQALAWLSRFPTIPEGYLKGGLDGQPLPPPTMVAQLDGDRRSGEFWSALGTPPRPTFSLVVTIAIDLAAEPVTLGPPVTAVEVRYGEPGERDALRQIGGRVRDAERAPVAGALVELPELGLAATTDGAGRYLLSRPADGSHRLHVSAAGFTPFEGTLVVPERGEAAKPELCEVTLTRQH